MLFQHQSCREKPLLAFTIQMGLSRTSKIQDKPYPYAHFSLFLHLLVTLTLEFSLDELNVITKRLS